MPDMPKGIVRDPVINLPVISSIFLAAGYWVPALAGMTSRLEKHLHDSQP